MIIRVTSGAADAPRHHGRLAARGRTIDCALGRSGIRADKREGDGATPSGRFPLRAVLYRADRLESPATALPCRAIAADDGWCDDPAHAEYNKPIRFPFTAGAEHLWRGDALYDLVVVIGHNDAPPVAGAGSAIFLHVAGEDLAPTQGCVALARNELIDLVAALAPGDDIVIGDAE